MMLVLVEIVGQFGIIEDSAPKLVSHPTVIKNRLLGNKCTGGYLLNSVSIL
jgi:hypothetical protein